MLMFVKCCKLKKKKSSIHACLENELNLFAQVRRLKWPVGFLNAQTETDTDWLLDKHLDCNISLFADFL